MSYNYEIYSQLNKYKGRDRIRLHMPGHKNFWEFKNMFPVAPIDVTELDFSDDLSCPSGAIKKAQEDIAEIVGAKRSYITTDGSSSGIMAMIYAASKFGKKIIVPRNSHKSVFNACRLFGVEPVIVQGGEYEGVLLPPPVGLIEFLIVNDKDICGVIVTSPDYYGNIAPLDEYAEVLAKYGRLLLCDGAHGAHLAFEDGRGGYAGVYADAWVDGAHKTLPTLTQGAYVNVNDPALIPYIEEGLNLIRTTSPSYPVMASVEYGVKYFVNNPNVYERARQAVEQFKEQMSLFTFYPSRDWAKLALDLQPLGISPDIAEEQAKKRGIYIEMNDGRYLLFYLSPLVDGRQLNAVKDFIFWLTSQKKFKNTYKAKPQLPPAAERTYSYLFALEQRSERIPLDESEGRMCACNAGITPPCVPLLIAGEIITADVIKLLRGAEKTFGLENGEIAVVKK